VGVWSALWIGWTLAFVVVEGAALYGKRHERDTLSANVQWLFVHNRPKWWAGGALASWFLFSGWFAWHIWFDL